MGWYNHNYCIRICVYVAGKNSWYTPFHLHDYIVVSIEVFKLCVQFWPALNNYVGLGECARNIHELYIHVYLHDIQNIHLHDIQRYISYIYLQNIHLPHMMGIGIELTCSICDKIIYVKFTVLKCPFWTMEVMP